jgi:phosphoribosylglycinamide formyltransferase-1
MKGSKLRVCFLNSSNGGNFKFFHLSIKQNLIKNIELFLISNKDCKAKEYAIKNHIWYKQIKYERNYNNELLEYLNEINPDFIITTWSKIIDEETVKKYNGKLINLHYSLLPAFAGQTNLNPIKSAIERNCQYLGVTCHYVDEGVDTGKIISQSIFKNNLSFDEIANEIFKKGCLILLNSVIILSKRNDIIEICNNDKWDYAPNLFFNDNLFKENFWNELSTL